MIPEFYDEEYLPGGTHDATWTEVQQRFGFSEGRRRLCERMAHFINVARGCGFRAVYLFGSFVTGKNDPNDIDLMWVYRGGAYDQMSDRCKDLLNYAKMKQRWKWDMFCCSDAPEVVADLVSGWTMDKARTKRRGIIRIDLEKFEGLIVP